MVGESPDPSSDASSDLKSRVLGEMRYQGIETSIRELVQESYEAAIGKLGSPLLSPAECRRLRQLVQNDLLGGMVVKD
jgi:hypothetical protein